MELTVPGDKSITQRALILASLSRGESCLRGILTGQDPQATANALRTLGAQIPTLSSEEIVIRGTGLHGMKSPAEPLDLENSGTGARLLLGLLAGLPVQATLTGDSSLRSRPMRRVTRPLTLMGARFTELGESDRLPIRVSGGKLESLDYDSPVASAQVKSALLLAGLAGGRQVTVREPSRSRDHTERMLRLVGADLSEKALPNSWQVELRTLPPELPPLDLTVPGDFSSAAFLIGLSLLAGVEVMLHGVGLNPTRTGLLPVLDRMGARVDRPLQEDDGAQPSGTVTCRPSPLSAVDIGAEEVPALIDEVPLIAMLAARAQGTTRLRGAAELRVKESDRLSAIARGLRALGVSVEELPDGLDIEGTQDPLVGSVESCHDHRIAMAFGILGAQKGNDIRVRGGEIVDVSFPGFWETVEKVKARAP